MYYSNNNIINTKDFARTGHTTQRTKTETRIKNKHLQLVIQDEN